LEFPYPPPTTNTTNTCCGNISDIKISNCIFTGNEAARFTGGCSFNSNASAEVYNCLFVDNTAGIAGGYWDAGGASVFAGAHADFINCTFTDNNAAYGSGLTVGGGGVATVTNCIFWGNDKQQMALDTYENSGGTLTVNYCDVQDGIDSVHVADTLSTLVWGNGNINLDPLFEDPDHGDFHLQDLSPCIASGIDSIFLGDLVLCCPTCDIEGNPRPDPEGSMPDMGAYESSYLSAIEDDHTLPSKYTLAQNYPNPFNSTTAIGYQLSAVSDVELSIYNLLGQKIETLVCGKQQAGDYHVQWDAGHLASGIYYYMIKAGKFRDVKKMVLIR